MKRILPFLVLFACKGPGPTEVDPTDDPNPTDEPTPTEPGPNGCAVNPESSLIERDLEEAHARYITCLLDAPDDPQLLFGKAFTELALMVDGPAFGALAAHCGETGPFGPDIYGPGGLLETFETQNTDHSFDLTAELVEDGTPSAVSILADAGWASARVYDGWSGLEIDIDIADDFAYHHQLSFDLYVDDVYADGSNVSLSNGLVIDVADMWDRPRYYTGCSDPGGDCGDITTEASGTITVNRFGTVEGDAIDLDFDMHLPVSCSNCGGATLHLVGNYTDTISDPDDLVEELPLARAILDSDCADDLCAYGTEVPSVVAEICPSATMDAVYDDARDLADTFRELSDAFDAAAQDPSLSWSFPAEAIFVLDRDTPMNQTDAKLLAGTMRTAAAALDLATGYETVDPDASFSSMAGPYSDGDWDWNDETCNTVNYEGVSVSTLFDQFEAHLGQTSAQADFAGARTELRAGIAQATAALDLQPTGDGAFDFSATPGWTNAIRDDANAVIASLDGTDGTLPSAPVWELTLDRFFDDVPNVEDLRSESGVATVFITDRYEDCETDLYGADDAGVWLLEDNRGFPITEAKIDAGQTPLIFDEAGYQQIEASDGIPRFFTPEIRDYFTQWD